MYWCCSVTMQIDRRINSTTDQREEERKVKTVGHPYSLQRALGSEVCRLLPFAHALAGCDTTSRLFGIGKGVDLRRLNTALTFKQMS